MEKKESIFTRVKRNWKALDQETRTWIKACGIWFVDGLMIGTMVTAVHKNNQARKIADKAATAGYVEGVVDMCKTVVQKDPFDQLDDAFTRLDKQGKVKKINF